MYLVTDKDIPISIHALLAESDHPKTSGRPHNTNFYPRSPCGERPVLAVTSEVSERISIHALLAESDEVFFQAFIWDTYFYPRSPCGERRFFMAQNLKA